MIEEMSLKENQQQIIEILEAHQNEAFQINSSPTESLSFTYTKDGCYLGGITGKLMGNRLHISLLAVKKEKRHLNIGTKLIKALEEITVKRECLYLTVNTQDFQGLRFYQNNGFEVFGELVDCPFEGTTKYYLRKKLPK
ncbi:GNAT family N-acetyltransferase [Vagococcus fluvialis]|uniref:GNAT family N-acetyltransferase n=1 Tax=Vagococcus fluvialis TaxID=2738 RepID=UPI00288C8B26|nr:GNAT family N-acetyltransferase [Vagococcus fluvialis]MDT2780391.1 GNAT family N-acetyltransferase [Vagococcus fluvialis]